MQHDQGFARSHWTRPLGNYLLRIAPAAARATANETTMQHVPTLLAISMAVAMRQYNTARINRWRRFTAFTKANKRHHRASTCSNITKSDTLRRLFRTSHREKELPNNNRGMTYQSDEKHLTNLREYLVGVVKLAINHYSNCFLLCVFTNNLLKYL